MTLVGKRKRGNDGLERKEKKHHTGEQVNEDEDATADRDETRGSNEQRLGDDDLSHTSSGGEDEGDNEDEEWEGFGEGQDPNTSGKNGSHGSGGRNLPPDAQELRKIKDASDLFRSSSFKLQIDALLPNVRPKYQRFSPVERFLYSLHSHLTSIPSISPRHPLVASKDLLKKGIAIPYPLPMPTEDTNWKVAFEKPNDIQLVGSWPNKLSVKGKDGERYGVDVAVEMPDSLFQEKDYLNGRFFHKRAYYLSVIAASILSKKSNLKTDVMFSSTAGNSRLTTLILRPKSDDKNDFDKLNAEIRIILVLSPTSPIPIQRLSPKRSNLRTSSSDDSASELPTPLYNNDILLASTSKARLLRTHALKERVAAYEDALTLLRVWANQRGYSNGSRLCVRGFEGKGSWWTAVLDLLISGEDLSAKTSTSNANRRKPLGKGLSSYQLFRAALDFFSRHDFSRSHAFTKPERDREFSFDDYPVDEAVLVDSISGFNYLAGVPLGSLQMLQHDAKLTLDTLNESFMSEDPFSEVFLKDQRDLQTRFDLVLRVDLTSAKLQNPSVHFTLEHGSPYNAVLATVTSSLQQALGNRAQAVVLLNPTSQPRNLSQSLPSNAPIVYVGVVLDSEHAFRLVDHGPAADNPDPNASKLFRDFWGDKAELRRFKDGSIVESVVWEVKTSDERAHIPYFICRHILNLHCGIPTSDVQQWQSSFDSLVRLPESITSIYQATKLEVGFKAAMTAFDGLVKSIKALDDELPLAVLNVSPISESLRYTNVFVPTTLTPSSTSVLPLSAQYLQPMEIIVEFEKSGRWPDDLRAIQKIKLAFFEHLASALIRSVPGLKASVIVSESVPTSDIQDSSSLEIITPQGWAFRARLWHDREATLLDNMIDDKPHIPKHIKKTLEKQGLREVNAKERRLATEAKEVYVRRFVHAPRHHRVIAALSHRFGAFAGTVRLVKRWLGAHWLLGGHVSVEVVELICASVFLGTGSSSPVDAEEGKAKAGVPCTKERGFFKVVALLKDWEWEKGLFVPLYGGSQDATGINATVDLTSKKGAWIVKTEFDPSGRMWTTEGPDAVVARRIKAIAKATWDCSRGIEEGAFDVKTMFSHPTVDYDFLVQLDQSVLPRYSQHIHADTNVWARKGKYVNAQRTDEDASSVMSGFDPAQLLFVDLARIYENTFKIFHDPFGGDRYGAVWDPSLKSPRPFRVMNGFSSIPVRKGEKEKEKDKGLVSLNTAAVLCEVQRMGTGLVSGIIDQTS
ncbi:Nrap protein [Abortiporus biennis]|nr:Nrap protein [Abortiporus biennis]